MVTTRNAELHDGLREMCRHEISHDAWNRHSTTETFTTSRSSAASTTTCRTCWRPSAFTSSRKLDRMNARRAESRPCTTAHSPGWPRRNCADRSECRHSWHLYSMRLNLDQLTVNRRSSCRACGPPESGTAYIHSHSRASLYQRNVPVRDSCSVAMAEYLRLVSLPIYPAMRTPTPGWLSNRSQRILNECSRDDGFSSQPRPKGFYDSPTHLPNCLTALRGVDTRRYHWGVQLLSSYWP